MLTTLLTTQQASGAARTPGRSWCRSFITRKVQQPLRETAVSAAERIWLGKCLGCSKVAFPCTRYRDNGLYGRVCTDSEGTGRRALNARQGRSPGNSTGWGSSEPSLILYDVLETLSPGAWGECATPCERVSTAHGLFSVDSNCTLALGYAYVQMMPLHLDEKIMFCFGLRFLQLPEPS